MQCPNCGKEALDINGRMICLDCGIEVAKGAPQNNLGETQPVQSEQTGGVPVSPVEAKEATITSPSLDNTTNLPSESDSTVSSPEVQSGLQTDTSVGTESSELNEKNQEEVAKDIYNKLNLDMPNNEPKEQTVQESLSDSQTTDVSSVSKAESVEPVLENLVSNEEEKVNITVVEKKEEAPSLNLTNAKSEELEKVEAKSVSEIVTKEPETPVASEPQSVQTQAGQVETSFSEPQNIPQVQSSPKVQMPVDTISNVNVGNISQQVPMGQASSIFPGAQSGTNTNMDVMPASGMARAGSIKKIVVIIIIVLFILGLFVAAYLYWDNFISLLGGDAPVEVIE